jgi:hypothetical protein
MLVATIDREADDLRKSFFKIAVHIHNRITDIEEREEE